MSASDADAVPPKLLVQRELDRMIGAVDATFAHLDGLLSGGMQQREQVGSVLARVFACDDALNAQVERLLRHQEQQRKIAEVRARIAECDEQICRLAEVLVGAENRLQAVLDGVEPELAERERAERNPVQLLDLVNYAHKVSYTTGTATPHKPSALYGPAPQETGEMLHSLLFTATHGQHRLLAQLAAEAKREKDEWAAFVASTVRAHQQAEQQESKRSQLARSADAQRGSGAASAPRADASSAQPRSAGAAAATATAADRAAPQSSAPAPQKARAPSFLDVVPPNLVQLLVKRTGFTVEQLAQLPAPPPGWTPAHGLPTVRTAAAAAAPLPARAAPAGVATQAQAQAQAHVQPAARGPVAPPQANESRGQKRRAPGIVSVSSVLGDSSDSEGGEQ